MCNFKNGRVFLQLPDGANVLAVGSTMKGDPRLVYVGGNCSVQGFDSEGNDRFWTVSEPKHACFSPVVSGLEQVKP